MDFIGERDSRSTKRALGRLPHLSRKRGERTRFDAGGQTDAAIRAGVGTAAGFGALLVLSGASSGLRFRSVKVALLAPPGLVATQVVYVACFAAGALRGR